MQSLTSDEKQQVLQQLQQELVRENFSRLLGTISTKCFDACIKIPSTRITNSEQDCIESCSEMYQGAIGITSRSYLEKLQKQ